MTRLCSLSRYWPVERTACAECLPASHTMHANATGLASLQYDVTALSTVDIVDEDLVTPAEVRGHVLPFPFELTILGAKWFSVLAGFAYLPQSSVRGPNRRAVFHWPNAVAGPPETIKGHPHLHIAWSGSALVIVFPPEASSSGCRTPSRVCPYSQFVTNLDELMSWIGIGIAPEQ
jgi:hypothetical protein